MAVTTPDDGSPGTSVPMAPTASRSSRETGGPVGLRSAPGPVARRSRVRRVDLHSESGFTLIELMVATVCGLIVAAATLAIVVSSVHLTSNFSDRVDATQEGRTAMQKITQALASSCVLASLPPVLPNTVDTANTISATSDATHLWFYSSLNDDAVLSPNLVEVTLTTGNSLLMYTYPYSSTTGAAPNWAFASTPTAFTLLQYAAPAVSGTTTLPVFAYFGYDSTGTMMTLPFPVPLSSANAAATAKVTISFEAIPSDNYTATARPASFSNSVVLRLTPASITSSTPCQ